MTAWLLILLSSLLTCSGQLLQKRAADDLGNAFTLRNAVRSVFIWLAILCLGFGALAWLFVLQRVDVGIAYPMLSLNFIWITLGAHWFFGERADTRHWIGLVLIVFGVVLLGAQH